MQLAFHPEKQKRPVEQNEKTLKALKFVGLGIVAAVMLYFASGMFGGPAVHGDVEHNNDGYYVEIYYRDKRPTEHYEVFKTYVEAETFMQVRLAEIQAQNQAQNQAQGR